MRRTDDLPDPDALLLDALRAAAHASAPRHAAGIVLAARGASAAAPAIAALATGTDAWRPPLCPTVGAEEATLIAAVALAQRGARREALALLCRALPPVEAYRAMSQAIAIGAAFRAAGQAFGCPWRRGAVPGFGG
jgi:hypothetical protein